MGRPNTRNIKKDAIANYERLRSQYDAKAGGYNIDVQGAPVKGTGGRTGRAQEYEPSKKEFLKSSYTPEQGGYHSDNTVRLTPADYKRFKIPERVRAGKAQHTRANTTPFYNADTSREIQQYAPQAKKDREAVAAAKSAAIPRKRVNPTVSGKRRTARRERALKYGREGTILTGTLGGSDKDDNKRKKTLLG